MARRDGDVPDLFEYAARRARESADPVDEVAGTEAPPDAPAQVEVAAHEAATTPGSRDAPLRVSQLVRRARLAVETALATVWVEGEIASLSRAASGHLYFVLKDDRSEVRAIMWRSDAQRLRFRLDQGMAVLCRARPTVYDQGGKFQMMVQVIEPAGVGADALAFEQLKAKLAGEGLFDLEKRRPLPWLPTRIGLVTSKSGAAVRDVIRAVQRRFPVPILVADAVVQGDGAPASLIRALRGIARCRVDVIIIGRGGGSASDLSAFNDERLVREVAACPIPIISAVGHEIDTSLCDLAADARAATPTMAGEMAVPVLTDLASLLTKEERRLRREIDVCVARSRVEIDRMVSRIDGRVSGRLHRGRQALTELRRRLESQHPRAVLVAHRAELGGLEARLHACQQRRLDRARAALADASGRLAALSPLRVLERGYALATTGQRVLKDAADVAPGDRIRLRLSRGEVPCVVVESDGEDEA